jgi:Protein of unknown function (DUF4230)
MPIIELIGILSVASLAGAVGWYAARFFFRRRRQPRNKAPRVTCSGVTQRVASVGRFVALEVTAKEIATASTGPQWLPPALLTRAKVAMIFHFRHEYTFDLAALSDSDIMPQRGRLKLRMPEMQSNTVLVDLEPYDIQSGKVFGLIEVIPMGAARQRKLMAAARQEAGTVGVEDEHAQRAMARSSAEKHIRKMLGHARLVVDFDWSRSLAQEAEIVGRITPADETEAVAMEREAIGAVADESTDGVLGDVRLPSPGRALKPVLSALAS